MAAVTTAGVDAEDDSCIYDVGVTNVRIIQMSRCQLNFSKAVQFCRYQPMLIFRETHCLNSENKTSAYFIEKEMISRGKGSGDSGK